MPIVKYKSGDNWVAVSTGGSIATDTTYGYLKVATDEDVEEGTDNTAAVTARQIKQIFDNNLVHRNGDETIDGNKTFNSNIRFTRSTEGFQTVSSKNLSLTLGTHPVNDTGLQIYAQDKDDDGYNNRIGGLFTYYTKEGVCATRITAYKPDKTDMTHASISVIYPETGNAYTEAPTPTDTTTTSGNQIATTGWVNSNGNNVVHKSGDETVSGLKTFTSNLYYELTSSNTANYGACSFWSKDSNLNITSNPSYYKEYHLAARDTENRYLGYVSFRYNTDGSSQSSLYARTRDADNTANKNASISVKVARDGTVTTYAPTPAANDNSTKIATTAWVNNYIISGAGCFPNYASHSSRSTNTSYTAATNGFLYVHIIRSSSSEGSLPITISGYTFTLKSNDYGHVFVWYPISKGTTYKIGSPSSLSTTEVTWFPAL